jgi:hypothetical protein
MLERRFCPPDRIAIAQVRLSEAKHGRAYVKKGRPARPGLDEITIDVSQWPDSYTEQA